MNLDCRLRIVKGKTFNSKPETRNPELLSVAFQTGEGFVDFFQVRLLAIAGEMQKQGVLQFRAVETDAQGLKSLLFEQPLLHLPVAIGSGMTARRPRIPERRPGLLSNPGGRAFRA